MEIHGIPCFRAHGRFSTVGVQSSSHCAQNHPKIGQQHHSNRWQKSINDISSLAQDRTYGNR
eukprot:14173409-Ditylum_brightwellii.AAC.1